MEEADRKAVAVALLCHDDLHRSKYYFLLFKIIIPLNKSQFLDNSGNSEEKHLFLIARDYKGNYKGTYNFYNKSSLSSLP
jgi:hypothetical protein